VGIGSKVWNTNGNININSRKEPVSRTRKLSAHNQILYHLYASSTRSGSSLDALVLLQRLENLLNPILRDHKHL
jgi:hypothetical protein